MRNQLFILLQRLIPQHALSKVAGYFADLKSPICMKNFFINQFSKHYQISLREAAIEEPTAYLSFNDFFIRKLKAEARPIDNDPQSIISPVDGTIAQIGQINQKQLLQAKGTYFDLDHLLSDADLAQSFYNGSFTTLYLAPHNYHRVHMPIDGKLIETRYVPGKLFSVNRITSELIPNLYGQNERLVCVFETKAGRMAVILVGALIVGSMQTVWMDEPIRAKQPIAQTYSDGPILKKGDEMGLFKLGSTVILAFEQNMSSWLPELSVDHPVKFGQSIGDLLV